ncbi:MAG TPA: flagellar motor switch protein FliM [Candidatus Kapabacteria bacterium]|jgi:flagellar motor switch protein FliM|nr:flagellar motor switch protein FliM [Candidatus Kapabacteria bacterium]
MAELLSQNEIDNLLSEMSSGRVNVDEVIAGKYKSKDISAYDFRRPNRVSKNQLRTMQTVHENFAETFGYYLVSRLQSLISVEVTSIDQLFYSEYILSVSNPSCLYVFDIEGTDGNGILEVSPQLALVIVEKLLGGSGEVAPKPRSITPIEQSVIRGIVEHALSDLRNAWRSITEINFKYSRLEMEADFVQIAPSSEIVLVVSFDVNIGVNTYLMNLCFPTFALEEVLAKLNRQQITAPTVTLTPQKRKENIELINKQISSTFLIVQAELAKTSITVGDFLNLEIGDIIKLDKKVNEEIEISINNRKKLLGRPGSVDGKRAVQVTRFLKEEDIVEPDLRFKEEI